MSVHAESGGHGFVLRGWHVLAGLLTFFGIVIAVNVVFATAAVRTFPGEDEQHPYIQGLDYNQTLHERRIQAAVGWKAETALTGDEAHAMLVIGLRTRDGTAIDGADLTGELRWPADAGRDREVVFHALGEGRYAAALGRLSPGQWRLIAHAQGEGGSLDFESDLSWPNSH